MLNKIAGRKQTDVLRQWSDVIDVELGGALEFTVLFDGD